MTAFSSMFRLIWRHFGQIFFFHFWPCSEMAILCLDRYMNGPYYTFWQKLPVNFFITVKKAIWQKNFWNQCVGAKVPKWQLGNKMASLVLLPLCTNFKNFFCQMASFWALWKSLLALFVLGPFQLCPCTYVGTKWPFLNKDDDEKILFCWKCLHMGQGQASGMDGTLTLIFAISKTIRDSKKFIKKH